MGAKETRGRLVMVLCVNFTGLSVGGGDERADIWPDITLDVSG